MQTYRVEFSHYDRFHTVRFDKDQSRTKGLFDTDPEQSVSVDPGGARNVCNFFYFHAVLRKNLAK